jgi:hypothetical protein
MGSGGGSWGLNFTGSGILESAFMSDVLMWPLDGLGVLRKCSQLLTKQEKIKSNIIL